MKNTILIFSTLILCILLLFQISKFSYLKGRIDIEILIAIIAIAFFFIGTAWKQTYLKKNKPINNSSVDFNKIRELKISNREYEVLLALTENLTNKEISEKLFISLSTTKTHVSKIYSKLDVSRRMDAIKKAEELRII